MDDPSNTHSQSYIVVLLVMHSIYVLFGAVSAQPLKRWSFKFGVKLHKYSTFLADVQTLY